MAITAESLLPGATSPWDSRNPILDRALRLDQDPVLATLTERHIVLVSKLLALRGLQEVPPEEKALVVAAELTVGEVLNQIEDNDRAESARGWLDPRSFPPYPDDFSYIEVKWIENCLEDSPFLGLAYENLPLRNENDRRKLYDSIAITALRRQIEQRRNEAKQVVRSKKRNVGYVSKRTAFGQIHNVIPDERYL